VINDVVSLSENMAQVKNITITQNISGSFMVYADKNMVSTILRNLISNAIKFTNRNGNISVEEDQNPDVTVITVCDTGVGIDQETLQNLFKLSEKVSLSGTENERGTGLGLILCKEFIEQNNGKIWVESEPGKGSSFKFTLPTHQSI
jgi:signal transduction histidine kinase